MDIKVFLGAIFIVLPTLINFASGVDSNRVALIVSPVHMKAVYGDPLRVDALSALITASGGDRGDWKWRKSGTHKLAKKLGPFESIDVVEFHLTNQVAMCNSHFSYGGQAAQVTSKAICRNVTLDSGRLLLRDVCEEIRKEMRNVEFVASNKGDGGYVLKTEKPTYWGWHIMLSVKKVLGNSLEFDLKLWSSFRFSKETEQYIDVEVDI